MKKLDWKRLTKRRSLGLVVMGLGVTVLFMPIFVGGWVLALLGVALVIVGLFHFVETVRSPDKTHRSRHTERASSRPCSAW